MAGDERPATAVTVVLRRADAPDDVQIHHHELALGDLLVTAEGRWRVVAREPADRVGVSARYICVPTDS